MQRAHANDNTETSVLGLADTALQATSATSPTEQNNDEEIGGKHAFTQPGARIKHYEIIRKLGEGGMGAVYLARDTRLGRRVAIKFLHEHDGPALVRFLVEARATALCRHENIVVIYDVDEFEGHPYMVLEYIEGRTLRTALHERMELGGSAGKPAAAWAIEIMLPVARALSAAHAMNIAHRDLKPENILLSNSGWVKVVDFGIAKQVGAPVASTPTPAIERVESLGHFNLTQHGASPGTMMYMSPEQWLSDEIDGRADIWAAGLILFELLTGDHPLAPVTLNALTQVIRFDTPMPSAKEKRPDAAALGEIIDRCLRKRKAERYGSAEELCTALEALLADRRAPILSDQCPFAGLSAFQESDAARYFGRDQDIAAVTDKLRNQELVAIVGPSGAGKSSFVRAGVIPALKSGGQNVETSVFRPGRKPLAALGDALSFLEDTTGEDARIDPATIEQHLLTEPGYAGVRLRARCRQKGPDHRILLFVDQFEELYTLGIDSNVREAFCASLLGIADDASSPLRVILSIRADFLDRLGEDRTFLSAVTRNLYFLPPMSADRLRDALTKPLENAQYQCEDDSLVQEVMSGLVEMKSPLPILQFLATKLWEARDKERRLLTTDAYRALGGVAGALSTHADAVVAAMSPAEQRITRAIFLRLVTPERTRAVVLFDELSALSTDRAAVEQTVQRLADARLIAIESGDDREGKTVELVHESLIERWGKLRAWLEEDELDAQFLAELRSAAIQWEKNGQAPGFLWRDDAARKAESWLTSRSAAGKIELGPRELGYLNAVVRFAQRTKRRRQAIVGGLFATTALIAIVVGMLAVNARKQAQRADEQAGRAREEAREARNATRVAAARQMQTKDPTKAWSLLREIEPGPTPRGWVELVLQTKYAGVAEMVRHYRTSVLGAVWSPDGGRIAATLYDRTIEIGNADGTGNAIVLRGHEHSAFALAWSHDDRRIASGSRDKTIRIWNADGSGTPVILTGHDGAVHTVDWSPDDRRLVAAMDSGGVRIWNTDGSNDYVVLGHETGLRSVGVAWSPDGQRLAIGANDGTLQIWAPEGNTPELVLHGHEGRIPAVAWSPDGQRIASAGRDKTVRIWNASGAGEAVVLQGHHDDVRCVQWSPDGRYLLSGSQDKTVRLWNIGKPDASVVLRGHEGRISSVAWSPDGRRIMSSSVDREIRLWNADFSKNNMALVGHTDAVQHASFSPDGERIASASSDKTLRIWNLREGGASVVLRGHEHTVNSVAFSNDGRKLVSASRDKTVRVWQADGMGEPVVMRGHDGQVFEALFTPDDRSIVSAAEDKTIRIWSTDGEKPPRVLQGHTGGVTSVAIRPDGQRLASGSADKTLRIWPIDGTGESHVLRGHQEWVWAVGWSPDGQRIVSGGEDWTLRLWNADGSGAPVLLEGHRGLSAVDKSNSFHPAGRWLVSSSHDGTIRIWKSDGTGESIALHAGESMVNSAAWSVDGKHIVAAFENNTVFVWRDIEIIDDIHDARLWTATNECLPVDLRQRLLGFSDAQAQADLELCQRRRANAFERPSSQP